MKQRENFGSRLGFVLVSAGCAVGLGNVWKFPYICGQYGGAIFILVYLVFLALLGFPILTMEIAVGRASQKSLAKAFDELEPEGEKWHFAKWAGILGNYLLMMFYTMVGGWMLQYAVKMMTGELVGKSSEQIATAFGDMLASPVSLAGWTLLAIVISFGIVAMGFKGGVEKMTKVMMCALIVLMIIMAGNSLLLDNSSEGVRFYLVPDFSILKSDKVGTVIFEAMSQAFFTLSIGIGSMEIFGSYLKKERRLTSESISIVCVDTFVALMAGFIIIPACFSFGIKPDAGPNLLFVTLPNVFNNMAGGRIWGFCFFVFMSFAAFTTIIAVFENIIAFFIDGLGWERKKAVILNIVLVSILSMPAVFGFNVLSGITPLGEGTNIMDLEDFLVSSNLLPLGSLIFVLFCTKKNGWGWNNFIQEVNAGEGMKFPAAMRFYVSYLLPLVIIVVYLKGYYDMFSKMGTTVLIFWMLFACLLLAAIFCIASGMFRFKKKDVK